MSQTTGLRNKVRVNNDGSFSLKGLNVNEQKSLQEQRAIVPNDSYIIALYDSESNEVYFVNESSLSSDPRAEII